MQKYIGKHSLSETVPSQAYNMHPLCWEKLPCTHGQLRKEVLPVTVKWLHVLSN